MESKEKINERQLDRMLQHYNGVVSTCCIELAAPENRSQIAKFQQFYINPNTSVNKHLDSLKSIVQEPRKNLKYVLQKINLFHSLESSHTVTSCLYVFPRSFIRLDNVSHNVFIYFWSYWQCFYFSDGTVTDFRNYDFKTVPKPVNGALLNNVGTFLNVRWPVFHS